MLARRHRLTDAQDFARIYKNGKRLSSLHLRLFYESGGDQLSRFGFVISKKQASKIVIRNRLKRTLRNLVQKNLARLKPGFNIIIQGKPEIGRLPPPEIAGELENLLIKGKLFL